MDGYNRKAPKLEGGIFALQWGGTVRAAVESRSRATEPADAPRSVESRPAAAVLYNRTSCHARQSLRLECEELRKIMEPKD